MLPPALAADALLPPLAFIGCLLRLYRPKFDAAIEWSESNLDLHPSSQIGRIHYAAALEFGGRTGEALAQYEMAIARSEAPAITRVTEASLPGQNRPPRSSFPRTGTRVLGEILS